MVGTVLSMYGLFQAFVRIPIGIGVDTAGKGRPYIIGGLLFAIAGAIVMAFGNGVFILALGRAFTGLAAGTWVPLIVVFAGFYPPKQAVYATSMLTLVGSLGRMFSTFANGFLNELAGFRFTFILAACAGLLAIIFLTASGKEKKTGLSITSSAIISLFARADVMLPSLMSLVGQVGTWAVTFSFMPILVERYGGNDITKSMMVFINLAALTLGNFLNTLITRKVKHVTLLLFTVVCFVAGMVLAALSKSLALLYPATIIMGLSMGFSYPTLMGLTIQKVEQSLRTTAMGIHQAVYAVGMFAGPWIGGILAERMGIKPMFAAAAGFILAATLVLLAIYRRKIVSSR